MVATPPQRILFANLTDADKAAGHQRAGGRRTSRQSIDGSGSLTVAEDDYHKARMLLAGQDLPKAAPGGYAILDQLPMGVSRAVEGERLRQARETELARSIEEIDAVAEARVHLATPEATRVRARQGRAFGLGDRQAPGRAARSADAQVRAIVNLVASSVPGMKPEVGDDRRPDGRAAHQVGRHGRQLGAAMTRIEFQRRVEDKYRAAARAAADAAGRRRQFHRRSAGRCRSRREPGDARKL